MEILELKAEKRTATGKGYSRTLRREGKIPAVLYGSNTDPVNLTILSSAFDLLVKRAKSRQQLINVDMGDAAPKPAMIKELQTRPVSGEYLHVDLYEVDMQRKLKVAVPVVITGKSIGVEMGGMLQIVRRELEILCFPGDIPEMIVIDITDLNVGDAIHVNDIELQGDMEISTEVNFTVITVLAPKKDVSEAEEEGEEEGIEEEGAEEAATAEETE